MATHCRKINIEAKKREKLTSKEILLLGMNAKELVRDEDERMQRTFLLSRNEACSFSS